MAMVVPAVTPHTPAVQAAEVAGISIQKRSVGMQQIVDCVSSGSHLVIALCDKRWLCSNMAYLMASDPEAVSPCLPPVCGFSSGFVGECKHRGDCPGIGLHAAACELGALPPWLLLWL